MVKQIVIMYSLHSVAVSYVTSSVFSPRSPCAKRDWTTLTEGEEGAHYKKQFFISVDMKVKYLTAGFTNVESKILEITKREMKYLPIHMRSVAEYIVT